MIICDDADGTNGFDGEATFDLTWKHAVLADTSSEYLDTQLQSDNWSNDATSPNCNLSNVTHSPCGINDALNLHYSDSISLFSESDCESETEFRSTFSPRTITETAITPCRHSPASSRIDRAPVRSVSTTKKSSRGRHRIVHDRRASLNAGMMASTHKSCVDIEEIVMQSDDDEATMRRKRNTVAARRSRARKQETLSAMSTEIKRLRRMIMALGADPDDDDTMDTMR